LQSELGGRLQQTRWVHKPDKNTAFPAINTDFTLFTSTVVPRYFSTTALFFEIEIDGPDEERNYPLPWFLIGQK
jgi:hypothetical protein